jgi:quinoprotein glucose dehydrogenase
MHEADLANLSPNERAKALARFRTLRVGELFTAPSQSGTVVLPGFDGGGEWGGAAVDTSTGVLYVNGSDVPWIAAMRQRAALPEPNGSRRTGAAVYDAACARCHGADKGGRDRAPSLVGLGTRLSADEVYRVLNSGRGFMPSFARLSDDEKYTVAAYLLGKNVAPPPRQRHAQSIAPYEFVGYERWRDSSGFPVIAPPWGTLSAIDLNTGRYRWRIPLGQHPGLTPNGVPTGTEQYGGPIVTAGSLVLIAATQDAKFRAFDKTTGELLWETSLPAAGFATPSTYAVRGKQYVVIAAGGGKLGTKSGDAYVAYTLP